MDSIISLIPVEIRGMSIFSLILFAFLGIMAKMGWSYMRKELKDINDRLDKHSQKIDDRSADIAEMKTDIALTRQSIQNIEEMMKMMRKWDST